MPTNTLQLNWTEATWALIQKAVHDEGVRTRVARRFLPLQTPADATTISSDAIDTNDGRSQGIEMRTRTTEIVELAVPVLLTQQEAAEADSHSAITLVTYAANLIANAEDIVIFQGREGVEGSRIFPTVRIQAGDPGPGLLNAEGVGVVKVRRDGRRTFTETIYPRVAEAAARLQERHAGRLALVLPTLVYPDTFAAIPGSPTTPKDQIAAFVDDRLYASGGLPADRGLVLALDGNTMDLVVTVDTTATYNQVERLRFALSVWERMALRLKDPSAVIVLEFEVMAARAPEAVPAGAAKG